MPSDSVKTAQALIKKALKQRRKFKPSKHPLYNDLVLRKIFCYLPKESILACRLVCKTWQNASLYRLQNDTLTIPRSIYQMKDLSNCIKRSTNWPLKKLVYNTEFNTVIEREFTLNSIIVPVSRWINEFHLRIHNDLNPILTCSNVLEFPHLRKFIFILSKYAVPTSAIGRNLFLQILEASPRLKCLEIRDDLICDESCGWVFSVLKIVQTFYMTRELPSLIVFTAYSPIYMAKIGELGLQLKSLSLEFYDNRVPTPDERPEIFTRCRNVSFINLFEPYASSLVSLKIMFDYPFQPATPSNIKIAFPRMKELEKLEIQTRNFLRMSCEHFSYSEQFPKLKFLAICHNCIPEGLENCLEFMLKPCSTVTTVTFEGYRVRNMLCHAWRLFPNTKCVIASISHVDVVCKYWQNLTELKLIVDMRSKIHINSLLTGLDKVSYIKLENLYKNGTPMPVILEHYQNLTGTSSTLLELQKLVTLKIKTVTYKSTLRNGLIPEEIQEISPLTCELILLKMEALECVDFCGNSAAVKKIPLEMLSNMRKRFQVLI